MSRGHFAVIATAVCLSLAYVYTFAFHYAVDPVALDYQIFWSTARREDLYANSSHVLFVNPPPAIFLIWPLKYLGFWPGYTILTIASLTAYVFAAARASSWQAAALSIGSAALLQGLILGQIAILLAAAILYAVTLPRFWMGLALGAVLAIKPQLLVMAPLILLIRRDFIALGGMALGAAIAIILSLSLGIDRWIEWYRQLAPFYAIIRSGELWKLTISWGFYARLLGVPVLPFLIAGGFVAILGADKAERADMAAMLVGSSLLVTPYALTHDLAAVIPAVSALLIGRPSGRSIFHALIFVGAFVPWSLVMLALLRFVERARFGHHPVGGRGEPTWMGTMRGA